MEKIYKILNLMMDEGASEGEILNSRNALVKLLKRQGKILTIGKEHSQDNTNLEIEELKEKLADLQYKYTECKKELEEEKKGKVIKSVEYKHHPAWLIAIIVIIFSNFFFSTGGVLNKGLLLFISIFISLFTFLSTCNKGSIKYDDKYLGKIDYLLVNLFRALMFSLFLFFVSTPIYDYIMNIYPYSYNPITDFITVTIPDILKLIFFSGLLYAGWSELKSTNL